MHYSSLKGGTIMKDIMPHTVGMRTDKKCNQCGYYFEKIDTIRDGKVIDSHLRCCCRNDFYGEHWAVNGKHGRWR